MTRLASVVGEGSLESPIGPGASRTADVEWLGQPNRMPAASVVQEHADVDGVGHCLIVGIARMPVVTGVEGGAQTPRV